MEILKVKIKDLVLIDGTPFPYNQAQTFNEKNWLKILNTTIGDINHLISHRKNLTTDIVFNGSLELFISMYRVHSLIRALKEGTELPYIHVRRYGENKYALVDGRHRAWAHILNGDSHMTAQLFTDKHYLP